MTLTANQTAALQSYAAQYGKLWKTKLADDWASARLRSCVDMPNRGAVLQGLRNDPNFGHAGLKAFSLSAPVVVARDFSAELKAASAAGDWDAHARIWDERRVAEVAADEAAIAKPVAAPKMTTKYVARLNGTIVGRRTTKGRTYTHAIIVQSIEEASRKDAYEYRPTKTDRSNFDYYSRIVAQGIEGEHVCVNSWRTEPDLKALADAKAKIEGGFDAFIARKRAEQIAAFEHWKAQGGYEPRVAAWAGRLDLAQKAVGSHTGTHCKLVAIVLAEVA